MSDPLTAVACCGLSPAEIWTRWRFDPVALSLLFAALAIYLVGARALRATARRLTTREITFFCAGFATAALALVSPLRVLSVALFSGHAAEYVVLTLLAAPLVVAGRPLDAAVAACLIEYQGRTWPRRVSMQPLRAAAAFALLSWLWLLPAAYAATFDSTLAYWTMHLALFGSACWLWSALLRRDGAFAGAFVASIASAVQIGLLGALVMLATRPLYAALGLATDAWGLTPLQDQQLGGVIMGLPGCTVFLVIATIALGKSVARGGARALAPTPGSAPARASARSTP